MKHFKFALQTFIALVCAASIALATPNEIVVQRGETLWTIASRHNVSVQTLMQLNNLNTASIKPGQILRLVATQNASQQQINPFAGNLERPLWPVEGIITQGFHRGHPGIDIAVPMGTQVHAALSGTIKKAGWDRTGYGNLVVVAGVDGRDYYYAHNSRLLVNVGQYVNQGDVISLAGSTGHSTGPHVHMEVRGAGNYHYSPLAVLPSSRLQQARFVQR